MGEPITREHWTKVLTILKPHGLSYVAAKDIFAELPDPILFEAIAYLADHGFVSSYNRKSMDQIWNWGGVALTAKGLDYLTEDGGLTAHSSTITVRFETETLKALLCNKVDTSDATEEEKSKIKHALRSLGDQGLKELTSELVKLGIQSAPGLVSWLGTALL